MLDFQPMIYIMPNHLFINIKLCTQNINMFIIYLYSNIINRLDIINSNIKN